MRAAVTVKNDAGVFVVNRYIQVENVDDCLLDAVMPFVPDLKGKTWGVHEADYISTENERIAPVDIKHLPRPARLMCGPAAIMALTGLSFDDVDKITHLNINHLRGMSFFACCIVLKQLGYETHKANDLMGVCFGKPRVGAFLDTLADDPNTYLVAINNHVFVASREGFIDNHTGAIVPHSSAPWRRHKVQIATVVTKPVNNLASEDAARNSGKKGSN